MKAICVVRDIYKALEAFEEEFEQVHGVSINEAMALCSLSDGALAASEIANRTGMGASHCSKVIRVIEEKRLIHRSLGRVDKRQMYFRLSKTGSACLEKMQCGSVAIPELLRPVFEKECSSLSIDGIN